MDRSVPIYFFVPENRELPFPEEIDGYWSWVISSGLKFDGRFSWTLQTYLQLKSVCPNILLTDTLPDKGIVIAHRDFFPDSLVPNNELLIVAIKPDRLRHPYAQVHLVQSLCDPLLSCSDEYNQVYFVPHWPQPDIQARASERAEQFVNVHFFGRIEHLAPELRNLDWQAEFGLNWQLKPMSQWHNYSDTDLVVAIRHFGREQPCDTAPTEDTRMKPFSKLVNCWLAGVPAIIGYEPSYLMVRESGLDYIQATNLEELYNAVSTLRTKIYLRKAMVNHGRNRVKPFATEAVKAHWHELLEVLLPASYALWQNSSFRSEFFASRHMISTEREIVHVAY